MPENDLFPADERSLTSSAMHHQLIVPNNSADLPILYRAIHVNTTGTISMRDETGTDLTYNVQAGSYLPFRPKRIRSTGTTAQLIGWW